MNKKICQDGRIWGQNNKEAGDHLGILTGCKHTYVKKGWNPNSGINTRFKKGCSHPRFTGGDKNPNWKGGITPYKLLAYRSKEYKEWRLMVFGRDDYTCQQCGMRGCYLHAHHILPWTIYLEKRYDLNNGVALCVECHYKTRGRQ